MPSTDWLDRRIHWRVGIDGHWFYTLHGKWTGHYAGRTYRTKAEARLCVWKYLLGVTWRSWKPVYTWSEWRAERRHYANR